MHHRCAHMHAHTHTHTQTHTYTQTYTNCFQWKETVIIATVLNNSITRNENAQTDSQLNEKWQKSR